MELSEIRWIDNEWKRNDEKEREGRNYSDSSKLNFSPDRCD